MTKVLGISAGGPKSALFVTIIDVQGLLHHLRIIHHLHTEYVTN